ncbi:MAG: hypothetical protein HKN48_03230 [Flavobacteriaceae bacterium]|nr:hypothetical protein [Flavobacteriaceae bacterium]
MMKKYTFFALLFLTTYGLFAQVGIGTTSPTTDLDINGSIRVRDLGSGTLVSDANGNVTVGPKLFSLGKVASDGTAIKISGATVTRVDKGDYKITFATEMADANYIVMLNMIDCGGACDGNGSYDDPGIGYYGQTKNEFYVNIGDSDNGNSGKKDIDLEFMFMVYDF